MIYSKHFVALVACLGILGLSGCGAGGNSNIAEVTGTVKVDGEPISYAIVSFMPAQGRASIGRTDADGFYELAYIQNQTGAVIGDHKVMITTQVVKEPEYGRDSGGPKDPIRETGRKELLPKKYCDRNKTELTATVEKGTNTIDFDLESK